MGKKVYGIEVDFNNNQVKNLRLENRSGFPVVSAEHASYTFFHSLHLTVYTWSGTDWIDLGKNPAGITLENEVIEGSLNGATGGSIFSALALKADDTSVVHKTGDEEVLGKKTFSNDATFNKVKVLDGNSLQFGSLGYFTSDSTRMYMRSYAGKSLQIGVEGGTDNDSILVRTGTGITEFNKAYNINRTVALFKGVAEYDINRHTDYNNRSLVDKEYVDGQSYGVQSVVAGTNVTIDATDPANPVVSATSTGGGLTDAPNDSYSYVRKAGAWDILTIDDVSFLRSELMAPFPNLTGTYKQYYQPPADLSNVVWDADIIFIARHETYGMYLAIKDSFVTREFYANLFGNQKNMLRIMVLNDSAPEVAQYYDKYFTYTNGFDIKLTPYTGLANVDPTYKVYSLLNSGVGGYSGADIAISNVTVLFNPLGTTL